MDSVKHNYNTLKTTDGNAHKLPQNQLALFTDQTLSADAHTLFRLSRTRSKSISLQTYLIYKEGGEQMPYASFFFPDIRFT